MDRARYIMIGGFLGAGKTTSIQEFAKYLDRQGLRVGLITNDQGVGLVDTALGKSNRFPVEGNRRRLLLLPIRFTHRCSHQSIGRESP